METIIQALKQAGYEVEATEPLGENAAITVVKDGLRGRITVPPSISAYGVTEMVKWVEFKYERMQAERTDKHEE